MRALAALGLLLVSLVAASAARADGPVPPLLTAAGPQPILRHPNPLFTNPVLDYVNPIPLPTGGVAWLDAPRLQTIPASVRDIIFLEYERLDDLGGFLPAPLHQLALTGGFGKLAPGGGGPGPAGRCLGCLSNSAQIALFRHQAGGKINSYTFLHNTQAFYDQFGGGPSSGIQFQQLGGGIGPTPPPPGSANTNPGANRCFGGCPKPPHHQPGKGHHPGHGHKPGSAGDCGTAGLSIVSNLKHCRIYVVNQAPGDSTFEQDTITNTSSARYVLSLQATGTETALWNDLQMGVWERGTTPPASLPPLHFWTSRPNPIVTLAPGQKIDLTIELYLPPFAGNNDQKRTAVIDFLWHAQAVPGH